MPILIVYPNFQDHCEWQRGGEETVVGTPHSHEGNKASVLNNMQWYVWLKQTHVDMRGSNCLNKLHIV